MTLGWLGTIRAPGALVLFWTVTLVSRVAGMPQISVVKAPVRCRLGPIIVPDATPVTTPRLSPFVCGVTVAMLCAGAKTMSTFACAGTAVGPAAMSG